jgi:hypothetical protein
MNQAKEQEGAQRRKTHFSKLQERHDSGKEKRTKSTSFMAATDSKAMEEYRG